MAKLAQRDLCLWVISPFSRRVRKFRVPFGSFLLFGTVFVLIGGAASGVFYDYARTQFSSAYRSLEYKSVSRERDQLLESNLELKSRLEAYERGSTSAYSIRGQVDQRLKELRSVLESATPLGVFAPGSTRSARSTQSQAPASSSASRAQLARSKTSGTARYSVSSTRSRDAIGGAEISCSEDALEALGVSSRNCRFFSLHGNDPRKSETSTAKALRAPLDPILSLLDDDTEQGGIVERLDRLIAVVRVLPLGTPVLGEMTSGFGYRLSPFSRSVKMHEGVDLSVPPGTSVFSTGEGTVRSVSYDGAYGLSIEIEHSPRVFTRFAHLSKAVVREGEKICRGEIIGFSGSTGRSTGPHLHYEVRIDDRAKNPLAYINLITKLYQLF